MKLKEQVQTNNRSSPMEECFQTFSQVIMANEKFENTLSLMLTGHYSKLCHVY